MMPNDDEITDRLLAAIGVKMSGQTDIDWADLILVDSDRLSNEQKRLYLASCLGATIAWIELVLRSMGEELGHNEQHMLMWFTTSAKGIFKEQE